MSSAPRRLLTAWLGDPARHAITASRRRRTALMLLALSATALSLIGVTLSIPHDEGRSALIGAVDTLLGLLLVALAVVVSAGRSLLPARFIRSVISTLVLLGAHLVLLAAHHVAPGSDPRWNTLTDAAAVGLGAACLASVAWVGATLGQHYRRLQAALKSSSARDALTGLHGRHGLLRAAQRLAPGTPATIVMIDLNHLKSINDTDGHSAGDAHIRAVARSLKSSLPPRATLARWGGDEFVVLLPGMTQAAAHRLLESCLNTAPRPRPSLDAFAFGLSAWHVGDPLERAVAVADGQMYERKRAQHDADAQETGRHVLTGIEAFTRQLESTHTSQEVLRVGLRLAADLLGFDGAYYYARTGDTYVLTEFQGDAAYASLHELQITHPERGEGLLGEAIRSRSTAWSNDYQNDPRAILTWVQAGLKSAVATPVFDAGVPVGVLGLTSFATWHSVTPQSRQLVEVVALRLGHAVERAHAVAQVRATLEGGLLALGVALEARDLETSGHTERVVRLAVALGRALGLAHEELENLKQGAYLHDIGKLCVPDAVLLKPGRLTPDEWRVMQGHARHGFEIAARIPTLPAGALSVIRHHHERWDGTGYPDGLTGEDIPLVARIFAVCDVYDALTSQRPYKRAWSAQEAMTELIAQRGVQFDPRVVDAFVSTVLPAGTPTPHGIKEAAG